MEYGCSYIPILPAVHTEDVAICLTYTTHLSLVGNGQMIFEGVIENGSFHILDFVSMIEMINGFLCKPLWLYSFIFNDSSCIGQSRA